MSSMNHDEHTGPGSAVSASDAAAAATDLAPLRNKLAGTRGKQYWRSLEEVAGTPEFSDYLHREFPENASEWLDPKGRRGFLKLMGASLALAGVSACTRQPDEQIVPYVRQPEEIVPGRPLFYATAMPLTGAGVGLLVESHEGRPTKIEGNPDHPSSKGASDVFAQASILELYDPDRSQTVTHLGDIRPYAAFVAAMHNVQEAQKARQGAGIRILSETVSSPTLAWQIRELLTRYPAARHVQYESVGRHSAREGSRLAFGEHVDVHYAVENADVIVSLDSDFLCAGPDALRHARAFASRRRGEGASGPLNRFYAVESTATNTGTRADHRLPLKASEIEAFARALAGALGVAGVNGAAAPAAAQEWIEPLVADLKSTGSRSLVVAGDGMPPAVHAIVHAINESLGTVGTTTSYTRPAEAAAADQFAAIAALTAEMKAGEVDLLVILGGNPVYTVPADLEFAKAMESVGLRVHHGLYQNETARLSHWHIPEAHFLETWSDVRAHDGTASIIQPLIAPLYHGKSAHEVVTAFSDRTERTGYDIVREFWATESMLATDAPEPATPAGAIPVAAAVPAPAQAATPSATPASAATAATPATAPPATAPAPVAPFPVPPESPFDKAWRQWLNDGVIPQTAFAARPMTVLNGFDTAPVPVKAGIEVVFRPDPTVYDGRFANLAWLQELPKPLTKLTWDNAALIAPVTAEKLKVENGDMVEIAAGDRRLHIPVWIAPGQAADVLTLHLGYGREKAGRVGTKLGFNVNVIRTVAAPFTLTGVEVRKTGERYTLASTQDHWSMEGRDLVRVASKTEFEHNPNFAKGAHAGKKLLSMYEPHKYPGHAWGMTIDQGVCTGCNACVVACVSENNIPVVGKDQVLNGREMHWLRIDRYYSGELDTPDTHFQPMPCQQCEEAPCEVVCPVAATAHSDEGLNDMAYNRCVGTRYCSNNCPYKVRRFNFLLYQDFDTPQFSAMRNPDVTVRSRGVMEKCTYCVQRINHARGEAIREERSIRDGEVLTACQSACPTDAIVFGDINDPKSRVAQQKASKLNYGLLDELNTKPRTTYLAVVKNPNPALTPAKAAEAHGGHE